MLNKALASAAVSVAFFATLPANAASWDEQLNLCAAAAEAEGLVTAGEYRAKFLRGGGGATKKLTIELIGDNGETREALCKIRRGKVSEIEITA